MSTMVFFCKTLTIFITLLFHIILNFQPTKKILGFNIFSLFTLFTLIYAKHYTIFSLKLMFYMNQKKCFYYGLLIVFVFAKKISLVIYQMDYTSTLKFLVLIVLFSIVSTVNKVESQMLQYCYYPIDNCLSYQFYHINIKQELLKTSLHISVRLKLSIQLFSLDNHWTIWDSSYSVFKKHLLKWNQAQTRFST